MDAFEILFTASFWVAAIRIASPLIFATMGELICERAGVGFHWNKDLRFTSLDIVAEMRDLLGELARRYEHCVILRASCPLLTVAANRCSSRLRGSGISSSTDALVSA